MENILWATTFTRWEESARKYGTGNSSSSFFCMTLELDLEHLFMNDRAQLVFPWRLSVSLWTSYEAPTGPSFWWNGTWTQTFTDPMQMLGKRILQQCWRRRYSKTCRRSFSCTISHGNRTAELGAWCSWGGRCGPVKMTFLVRNVVSFVTSQSGTRSTTWIVVWSLGASTSRENTPSTSDGARGSHCVTQRRWPGRTRFLQISARKRQFGQCERQDITHGS